MLVGHDIRLVKMNLGRVGFKSNVNTFDGNNDNSDIFRCDGFCIEYKMCNAVNGVTQGAIYCNKDAFLKCRPPLRYAYRQSG